MIMTSFGIDSNHIPIVDTPLNLPINQTPIGNEHANLDFMNTENYDNLHLVDIEPDHLNLGDNQPDDLLNLGDNQPDDHLNFGDDLNYDNLNIFHNFDENELMPEDFMNTENYDNLHLVDIEPDDPLNLGDNQPDDLNYDNLNIFHNFGEN